MSKVTIDGREAEFEDGLTIIRAAERLGIEVPHYCWHPGLTIAGNCRMCLVEIEKVPKLQIACNTRITEGMVVHTGNERVKRAQESVLEFLLVNHPIDCPICDQAGECKLQDYYMDFDRKPSRFPVEQKTRKRKVVDLGPRVVLDQERCILCLRCTRFLDEVTGTSELGVFERGDRAFIDLAPGKRLDNPYSENVVDICPVGALTSKAFRFRARVWYLQEAPSVCTSCARGCNISIYQREGQIFRFRPRYNPDVNQYWMCDTGRTGLERIQGPNRLLHPGIREADSLRTASWEEALEGVATRMMALREVNGSASVAVVVSAEATNEEAYLARSLIGTDAAVVGHAVSAKDGPGDDELLIRGDRSPNRCGLEAMGIPTAESAVRDLLDRITKGEIHGLVVIGADLVRDLGRESTEAALEKLDFLVVLDLERSETTLYADVVLPIASFAETDGTITNFQGRVQRLVEAFPPPAQARAGWTVLAALSGRINNSALPRSASEVFAEIAARVAPFVGLTMASVSDQGALLARGREAADRAAAEA